MTLTWRSHGVGEVPAHDRWLSPTELAYAQTLSYTKRRTEWRLARWTAKHTVATALALAVDEQRLAAIEIRPSLEPETRGAPQLYVDGQRAPAAVSLTDRADWAVCVVGGREHLGCDLELVEPRSDAFVRDYLTPAEQALVFGTPPGDRRDALANLVWSAKESALKVLQTGLRRDTRSVEVSFGEPGGDEPWHPLTVRAEEGATFTGWWARFGAFVLTVAADHGIPPPASQTDPPGLATAAPGHSWLAGPKTAQPGPV
jgi:4'-phosphopantetheinyl transferase